LLSNYLNYTKKLIPDEPVIHIDDSDVIKPQGHKFESLSRVRDGSASTSSKNVYDKGYHVTEACAMTRDEHPVSIFSQLHSSKEKDFKSKRENSILKAKIIEVAAPLKERVYFLYYRIAKGISGILTYASGESDFAIGRNTQDIDSYALR